jgi:hypothetical protein
VVGRMRFLCFVLWFFALLGNGVYESELVPMREAIIREFSLAPSYGLDCNGCATGHQLGGMVRLVFHDAVGGPGHEGANG